MRLLLDACAYVAMREGRDDVLAAVRGASRILFSTIVLGELLAGFRSGDRLERNARDLDEFLRQPGVRLVSVRAVTADRYARVYSALRAKGRPIPTNDMWIAAQALETGALLVSPDRHFESVDGLALLRLSA